MTTRINVHDKSFLMHDALTGSQNYKTNPNEILMINDVQYKQVINSIPLLKIYDCVIHGLIPIYDEGC